MDWFSCQDFGGWYLLPFTHHLLQQIIGNINTASSHSGQICFKRCLNSSLFLSWSLRDFSGDWGRRRRRPQGVIRRLPVWFRLGEGLRLLWWPFPGKRERHIRRSVWSVGGSCLEDLAVIKEGVCLERWGCNSIPTSSLHRKGVETQALKLGLFGCVIFRSVIFTKLLNLSFTPLPYCLSN